MLYKCPDCLTEGEMEGKGTTLSCKHCGKKYELTEYGFLEAHEGETKFDHVPDWFAWQRTCVREEIERGEYGLDVPVDIYVLADTKKLYNIGEGRLVHSFEGFHLTGCDGKLDYMQKNALFLQCKLRLLLVRDRGYDLHRRRKDALLLLP